MAGERPPSAPRPRDAIAEDHGGLHPGSALTHEDGCRAQGLLRLAGVPTPLRAIDWGSIAPLRLRARAVADGVYAGAHRSLRRGPGVEFGGHREYVPGDDLRWLDHRALLRHDKLLVREFETETDRGLRIVVDASASMAFRGEKAPASKFAFAALLAAALARIALAQR